MKKREPLRGHEQVYHAALWRQAASLSLTPRCLRGEKKPCPPKGKKRAKVPFFAHTSRRSELSRPQALRLAWAS
jgi:hypothetical protein